MKTLVSIPHHEYPTRIRDRVEAKLQELLHFHDRILSVRALLERESERHRVELVAHVGHGVTLVVDARAELLDAALDLSLQRMVRVLQGYKGRRVARRRKSPKA